MGKFTALLLLLSAGCFAQCTVTVTAPGGGNPTISGTSYSLQASVVQTSCTNQVYTVAFRVNGECISTCYSYGPPSNGTWSLVWNTNFVNNNPYNTVVATAYDVLGNVLATSPSVSFTTGNSVPWSTSQLSMTCSPPSSPWTGTLTITCNFTGSQSGNEECYLWVDGWLVTLQGAVGSCNLPVNTTTFDNATHHVVITSSDNNIGGENHVGQWVGDIVFSNSASSMEIRSNVIEAFCVAGVSCNPTSLTCTLLHTDQTTSGCTSPSYSSSNSSVVTVNASTGALSPFASGEATITISANGFNRNVYAFVNTSAITVPHFQNSGTISTANGDANSVFVSSMFFTNSIAAGPNNICNDAYFPGYTTFPALYQQTGYTHLEIPVSQQNPSPGTSQGTWQGLMDTLATNVNTCLSSNNLYGFIFGGEFGTPDNYGYTVVGSTYSPKTALAYASNDWVTLSSRVWLGTMSDEVNSTWGPVAQPGTMQIGSTRFPGPITCVNGVNCTATCGTPPNGCAIQTGNDNFIITGSGDTNLDYDTSSGCAAPYTASGLGGGSVSSFTFPTPAGVGNHTYTAGSNPGLTLKVFVAWTYDASGNAGPPGGGSSGPCASFVDNTAFANYFSQWHSTASAPKINFAPVSGTTGEPLTNWIGSSSQADFWNVYTTGGGSISKFLQHLSPVSDLLQSNLQWGAVQGNYNFIQRNIPTVWNDAGTNSTWGFIGRSVGITSISASGLATFSAPHGISNLQQQVTRIQVSGNSAGANNVNFFPTACPTPTTCQLALAQTDFAGSATGGIVTWQDTTTTALNSISFSTQIDPSGHSNSIQQTPSCPGGSLVSKKGQTFTPSGTSGLGGVNGTIFYFLGSPGNTCTQFNNYFWQMAHTSGTGGTAQIVDSNAYVRGVNVTGPGGALIGARTPIADVALAVIERGSGMRTYGYQGAVNNPNNPNNYAANFPRTFSSCNADTGCIQTIQGGVHPYWDNGNQNVLLYQANAVIAKFFSGMTKYLYQPAQPVKDLGPYIIGAGRGSPLNFMIYQSLIDGNITRTIDLSGFSCGNTITKYTVGWQGVSISTLSSGTTSASVNFTPDASPFVAFACPSTALTFPQISARLADIPTATKIVMQYSFEQYPFSEPTVSTLMQPLAIDCGSGSCAPLWDRSLGTMYYRLAYLNSSGQLLGFGGTQTY